ncbi:cupin domain-containing protein [Marinibactrum halimedae]|uniref:JmjC domain-containing protein n=1 Tax=Marinibactrum halimedae TaxID=1444977 RepID=A0AA37T864_9GAMM|nr:cupin domain-containing protein [Marinibactrum halimedae]MCD9460405.1 cupin domain-containing protein [Marinibactrum halimedae]GLS27466.1 hypothetical protein GCM10007877_31850 [Marinibactrum halimedae]
MSILQQLGHLTVNEFLESYWQQKPVLLRGVFPEFQSPDFKPLITANELAGLALEEDIESRIILEKGNLKQTGSEKNKSTPWALHCGPFEESIFAQLPESHWTLLVQAVDHYSSDIAQLLERFHFIPSWRLDDMMISYAADGGSVGPHYDQYDVFLLQAEGKRRWKIGPTYDEHAPKVDNTPLHILKDFQVDEEWLVEPGDVLYVPPQYGHWGVAEGECLTYSVGFRAPSAEEILAGLGDHIGASLSESQRFSDAKRPATQTPGVITSEDVQRIQQLALKLINNPEAIAQWLGYEMTHPKYGAPEITQDYQEQDILELILNGNLEKNTAARFAYLEDELTSDQVSSAGLASLFVDGESYTCSKVLAQLLCDLPFTQLSIELQNNAERLSRDDFHVLSQLLNTGALMES